MIFFLLSLIVLWHIVHTREKTQGSKLTKCWYFLRYFGSTHLITPKVISHRSTQYPINWGLPIVAFTHHHQVSDHSSKWSVLSSLTNNFNPLFCNFLCPLKLKLVAQTTDHDHYYPYTLYLYLEGFEEILSYFLNHFGSVLTRLRFFRQKNGVLLNCRLSPVQEKTKTFSFDLMYTQRYFNPNFMYLQACTSGNGLEIKSNRREKNFLKFWIMEKVRILRLNGGESPNFTQRKSEFYVIDIHNVFSGGKGRERLVVGMGNPMYWYSPLVPPKKNRTPNKYI